ncbi:MAG: hypothetical protein KDB27_29670 [Planctomycetales bacterium]|nr:hypothetical protein [Planctomycetales bacterium]
MKALVRTSGLLVVLLFLVTPTLAEQMFIFGDSLSMRRFADGPVWHEYFTERMDWPTSRNYSGGGASSGGGMTSQINQYFIQQQCPDSG